MDSPPRVANFSGWTWAIFMFALRGDRAFSAGLVRGRTRRREPLHLRTVFTSRCRLVRLLALVFPQCPVRLVGISGFLIGALPDMNNRPVIVIPRVKIRPVVGQVLRERARQNTWLVEEQVGHAQRGTPVGQLFVL